MTTISEAKAHLSALVRRVEQGETLVIVHRGRPVARLSPVVTADDAGDEECLARLERSGLIRRPLESRDSVPLDLADDTSPVLSEATGLVQAVLEERAES